VSAELPTLPERHLHLSILCHSTPPQPVRGNQRAKAPQAIYTSKPASQMIEHHAWTDQHCAPENHLP
jgi:hypothetical protein